MSTPTHDEVLATIDKARTWPGFGSKRDRKAHCDDLRATTERHAPHPLWPESCGAHSNTPWPCPDYRQVIDRLTGWGVL